MQKFDLIVIGSGSGLDVANFVAEEGLSAAVVEDGPLGGTCLNRGCIPSKMLIHSADVMDTIKNAHKFGIQISDYKVDFPSIVERVTRSVDSDSQGIEKSLRSVDNPKLFKSKGKFIEPKTLQVGSDRITADKILLSSGGRPSIPKVEGLEGSGFMTSDEALRIRSQPRILTIIGGGYIAVELAHFFGSLGTTINIVQRRPVLVPNEDQEVAREFTRIFGEKYNVLTGWEPSKVSKRGEEFDVTIRNVKTQKTRDLQSDQLLVAVGRTPNSDAIGLENTGVKTDKKGYIITDEFLETSVKGIFALGDSLGHYLFKHSANLEAAYDFNNILNDDNKIPVDYNAMPHAIFSSPQIAGVGKTEQELRAENADYAVGRYKYSDTAMGDAIEDQEGFVKILVDRATKKILGCHIMGTEASTLIHEVVIAMKSGEGSVGNVTTAVFVHPTLSEVVQRAATNIQYYNHETH